MTRKFMEQGYHIAIANSVAMLGFAAKDNVLIRAITSTGDGDIQMSRASANDLSLSITAFKNAQRFSNTTLKIILKRIRDPNVLPFIHVILVFMLRMSRHSSAIGYHKRSFLRTYYQSRSTHC